MTHLSLLSNPNSASLAEWLILLVTFFGIVIALFQFYQYRKEIKLNTFINFRHRFKSDEIILKILKSLNNGNNKEDYKFSDYEVFHFLGFYEELEHMYTEKQIGIKEIDYFFGYYFIQFYDTVLIERINKESIYWEKAIRLYELLKTN